MSSSDTAARPAPSPARLTGGTIAEMIAAAVVAAIVSAAGLFAFGRVSWPAFPSSNVTQAVTTVGQVVTIAVLSLCVVLYRARRWARAATVLSWAGLSGFVTVTLGMPLSATKLYLHGVSVDQEFRTEYLTRLTDSAALHDMTYADLPPYYPAGWFWIGGRLANLVGFDGWEMFKPYAIASIAVAAVLALVLWSKLIRADRAVVAGFVTAALVVAYGSAEPYGAVIAVLVPPVLVLAWGGLHRPGESGRGGWGAVAGVGIFLGVAAAFYTLYLGFTAFAVTLMAVLAAGLAVREKGSWRGAVAPLVRLAVAAVIAGALALVVWLPYLLDAARGSVADSGTATHYLPDAGARLPLPMFQFSLAGALCLVGTVWLVGRVTSSRRAQSLGIGVAAVYLWSLLSMAVTVVGSTLLSFRLEPVLILLLGTAGVFGFLDFGRWIVLATSDSPRVKAALVTLGLAGLIGFSQNIPQVLASDITVAYTDTDGDGVRADQRPPGAAAYFADVDRVITERRPGARHDTVVLTSDTGFLSFYPYYGFQALTSHYANPLAQFRERSAAIESWSDLETPDQFHSALDALPWRAPDVFVFRKSADGYVLRLAEDVYPNDPNVRRYTVTLPAELFDDPRFTIDEVGPFVVVTRVG